MALLCGLDCYGTGQSFGVPGARFFLGRFRIDSKDGRQGKNFDGSQDLLFIGCARALLSAWYQRDTGKQVKSAPLL